ncbi:MAG: excinuclease ABC subunit C [Bacteroidales bacterium]|nr:excinuclease ABC subunit C [Bacteroidales bacterium]
MPESPNLHIKLILKSLPAGPGVYKFLDADKEIIYIGKARNLKKRVSSYFHKEHSSAKLKLLVRKINNINVIHVNSEFDALLLENNLIKEYKPRYNVLLKDDKTYPWICITSEDFPTIFSTRSANIKNAEYFGPYPSVRMMRALLELIRNIYPLRTCKLNLTEKSIAAGKFKSCLQYQIGKCLAPCEGKQSRKKYMEMIEGSRFLLKGNIRKSMQGLKSEMLEYSKDLEFEKAQKIKDKLDSLEKYQSKSMVSNARIGNMDVFSIVSDEQYAFVNFLRINEGSVIQGHTLELKKKIDETDEEMLLLAFGEFLNINKKFASEVLIPFKIDAKLEEVKFIVPLRGDKKQILDLSFRNAKQEQMDQKKRRDLIDPERHSKRIMETMQKELRLKSLPTHIECFDNSNFQGTDAVAACVVFRDARPAKRDYRHFNIKTVVGSDDFASMKEVLTRRYKRLVEEKQELPQLVIVDGGKGQLSSAVEALKELNLYGKIAVIGIAKKLEEIYFPGDSLPLYIDKRSESLKLIQRMRDEAHRFGITHHRSKRDKKISKSELENAPGIGRTLSGKLLKEFGSFEKVKKASKDDLAGVIGERKSESLMKWINNH